MLRKIGLAVLFAIMASEMVGPAAAQSCQIYYDRARSIVSQNPSDLNELDRLLIQVKNSSECSGEAKTCFSNLVGDSYADLISRLQAKGVAAKRLEELAVSGASAALTPRTLWTMASFEDDKKNYDRAAELYQQALTSLRDIETRIELAKQKNTDAYICPGEEATLPDEKQTDLLVRLTKQALALSKNFVPAPPTRAGTLGGIFVGRLRGIQVFPDAPVEFKYDSIDMTEKGAAYARQLLDYINASGSSKIVLSGHTDQRGSDDYNCALSKRRLDALVAFFKPNMRKDVLIEVVPQGKKELVDIIGSKTQDEIDQINRRVELRSALIVRRCR